MSTDNNWWRCPRSSSQLESRGETTWPDLSAGRRRPLRRKPRGSLTSCDYVLERTFKEQSRSVDRSSLLDNEGYPELGQRLSKRKLPGSLNPLPGCSEEVNLDKLSLGGEEDRAGRRFSKKPRTLDLLCIDIKKALERQRSLSESQTSSSQKPRIKLNVNLSIRNPLDSAQVIQCRKGKQREVRRGKKSSKIKRLILNERKLKKELNVWKRELFEMEKIKSITKGVGEIDFGKLKISGEPSPELTFVRDMSSMNLFDNKHRKPPSDNLPDDVVPEGDKSDVVNKLESLMIRRDDDVSPDLENYDCEYSVDPGMIARTLCLKICDETGETVEEFEKPEMTSTPVVAVKPETTPDHPKHSRIFREYCTNDLTPGLNKASENFLAEIYRLQRRMYERDEVKGRCRRRFYAGFKEVLKHVESKKVRFVFIAPDLEGIHGYPGGLDEFVSKLIAACKVREIVFCFCLNKRKLGYYTHKKGSVSCVGIANYAGLEELFKEVLTELMSARNSYGRYLPPCKPGADDALDPSSEDWNDALLSTRINLLFKSLTVTACS